MVNTKKNSTLSNGSVTKNKCSHVDHEDEAALGSLPALSSSSGAGSIPPALKLK
jgi:hypothetical protein